MNNQLLKGKIISSYGAIGKFEEDENLPKKYITRLLHSRNNITTKDVALLATKLNLSDTEIVDVFIRDEMNLIK